mmetsp:Transcript_14313/g.35646  ORF Transcript_14313/g.35646 Transcript_14313/m.35646 type:complete len:377 (-) Transcript_14313:1300-2430(-)
MGAPILLLVSCEVASVRRKVGRCLVASLANAMVNILLSSSLLHLPAAAVRLKDHLPWRIRISGRGRRGARAVVVHAVAVRSSCGGTSSAPAAVVQDVSGAHFVVQFDVLDVHRHIPHGGLPVLAARTRAGLRIVEGTTAAIRGHRRAAPAPLRQNRHALLRCGHEGGGTVRSTCAIGMHAVLLLLLAGQRPQIGAKVIRVHVGRGLLIISAHVVRSAPIVLTGWGGGRSHIRLSESAALVVSPRVVDVPLVVPIIAALHVGRGGYSRVPGALPLLCTTPTPRRRRLCPMRVLAPGALFTVSVPAGDKRRPTTRFTAAATAPLVVVAHAARPMIVVASASGRSSGSMAAAPAPVLVAIVVSVLRHAPVVRTAAPVPC